MRYQSFIAGEHQYRLETNNGVLWTYGKQLDRLWQDIGWMPRGENKWQEVITKSSFCVGVFDEGSIVGFGRLMEDGIMCMFYDIGVHPDVQGRGVGTKVMNTLLDKVKDKGYASIGLFAWEQNPANVPFYNKFGFERVATGMECVRHMKRE